MSSSFTLGDGDGPRPTPPPSGDPQLPTDPAGLLVEPGRAGTDLRALTDDNAPEVWPECPTCSVAYVFKRGLSWGSGWRWVWSADCKHKADPHLVTAHGVYERSL